MDSVAHGLEIAAEEVRLAQLPEQGGRLREQLHGLDHRDRIARECLGASQRGQRHRPRAAFARAGRTQHVTRQRDGRIHVARARSVRGELGDDLTLQHRVSTGRGRLSGTPQEFATPCDVDTRLRRARGGQQHPRMAVHHVRRQRGEHRSQLARIERGEFVPGPAGQRDRERLRVAARDQPGHGDPGLAGIKIGGRDGPDGLRHRSCRRPEPITERVGQLQPPVGASPEWQAGRQQALQRTRAGHCLRGPSIDARQGGHRRRNLCDLLPCGREEGPE